jgi:hypothetical protein
MPAQKQAGHVTLYALIASKSMAFGQVSAVFLQEVCKHLGSVHKRRSIRLFLTCPQAVDEPQHGSGGAEILKVEGGVLLGEQLIHGTFACLMYWCWQGSRDDEIARRSAREMCCVFR